MMFPLDVFPLDVFPLDRLFSIEQL